MTFKPLLASPAELDSLIYPLYASPKLDGIRAMVRDGKLVSRKLLPIPNKHVQRYVLGTKWNQTRIAADLRGNIEGFDGELILGDPTAHDVYRKTNSAVMSFDKEPAITFHVFDHFGMGGGYQDRLARLTDMLVGAPLPFVLHPQTVINDRLELDTFEEHCIKLGYEGIITRRMDGHYKFGRSTAKEQIMLKVKRFEDSEAEVLGTIEEMFNGNEAERDALGRTKRSKAKAGLVGKGTMGALSVRDLKTGVEFEIGSGFTAADRAREWKPGTIVKYKFFPVGVKDKPRHPVYIGERARIDL
jgi:DNA ligase-1